MIDLLRMGVLLLEINPLDQIREVWLQNRYQPGLEVKVTHT